MKTLRFTRPHSLSTLHDELVEAIPALAPLDPPDPLAPEAREPVISVEQDYEDAPPGHGDRAATPIENGIRLTVPDDADEEAIRAVVDAHHPAPRPPEKSPAERVADVLRDEAASPAVDAAGLEAKVNRVAALIAEVLDPSA